MLKASKDPRPGTCPPYHERVLIGFSPWRGSEDVNSTQVSDMRMSDYATETITGCPLNGGIGLLLLLVPTPASPPLPSCVV
jgi:hypothetical protein